MLEKELLTLFVFTFGVLITVLGWIGARVHSKLDELTKTIDSKLTAVDNKLGGIERDLRQDLAQLDRRVTRVESHIES